MDAQSPVHFTAPLNSARDIAPRSYLLLCQNGSIFLLPGRALGSYQLTPAPDLQQACVLGRTDFLTLLPRELIVIQEVAVITMPYPALWARLTFVCWKENRIGLALDWLGFLVLHRMEGKVNCLLDPCKPPQHARHITWKSFQIKHQDSTLSCYVRKI